MGEEGPPVLHRSEKEGSHWPPEPSHVTKSRRFHIRRAAPGFLPPHIPNSDPMKTGIQLTVCYWTADYQLTNRFPYLDRPAQLSSRLYNVAL